MTQQYSLMLIGKFKKLNFDDSVDDNTNYQNNKFPNLTKFSTGIYHPSRLLTSSLTSPSPLLTSSSSSQSFLSGIGNWVADEVLYQVTQPTQPQSQPKLWDDPYLNYHLYVTDGIFSSNCEEFSTVFHVINVLMYY